MYKKFGAILRYNIIYRNSRVQITQFSNLMWFCWKSKRKKIMEIKKKNGDKRYLIFFLKKR